MKTTTPFQVLILLTVVVGVFYVALPNEGPQIVNGKIDDWKNIPVDDSFLKTIGGKISTPISTSKMESLSTSGSLGFSAGGAKDINNFRENIKNGFLPLSTDITYEGLFYDYYFNTGSRKDGSGEDKCAELFCPSYSYAVSRDPLARDPLSNQEEYYMTVGLNSGMAEQDFHRKKLNLIVVLDISGSMSSPFNKYYYDQFGNKEIVEGWVDKSKMRVAGESVVDLLGHLSDDDTFGMVVFDNSGVLAKPLRSVGETDMNAIQGHILELQPRGGTNMAAGMKLATEQFSQLLHADQEEYENRIIFLTDAMPNRGETEEDGLLGMTKNNAAHKIHTTFIGIGVDFNTELVEHITKIQGANYYSVHSSVEFNERMDEGFEYMVTPLVFDLKLDFESDGFEIEKVYGSPEANEATGQLMKVNTLFPSKTKDGETKGGVVVLKLRKIGNGNIKLKVSYNDRQENVEESQVSFEIREQEPEFFDNTGIRKAVLLSRYVNLMKEWINDERSDLQPEVGSNPRLGRWERQSAPLTVSNEYKQKFVDFKDYFESEMQELGDSSLQKEIKVLEFLTSTQPSLAE